MRCFALLVALGCTAVAASAQRTWVVDWQNRAGTDFTAIQPAVDAAAPGDTILVRGAGLYPEPPGHAYAGPTIDGKGVNIVGEGAATTWIPGPWTIRNLPAAQSVTVANFQCGMCCLSQYQSGMTLTNNAGLVVMSDIVFEGDLTKDITDCAAVVARNCAIQLFNGFRVIRSNLMLDGISIASHPFSTLQGSALYCERSKVWITNSLLQGADLSSWSSVAEPAIRTRESEIWIGYGSTVQGGLSLAGREAIRDAWQRTDSSCLSNCTFSVQPTAFHVDPAAQMIGDYLSIFNPYDPRPITSIWARENAGTLTVHQRCSPGSLLVLGIGPLLAPPIQGPPGMLAIDPAQALLWWTTVPSGTQQATFAVPPSLPFGLEVGLQLLELTTQGDLRLSNATVFGVW